MTGVYPAAPASAWMFVSASTAAARPISPSPIRMALCSTSAPKIPQFPGKDPDMMKLISGWRWAAAEHGEASLQMFLLRRGLPVPLSDHILKNSSKQIELLSKN